MSATTVQDAAGVQGALAIETPVREAAARADRLSHRWLVPLGALLASRLLVALGAGLGTLLPRSEGWTAFDPNRVSSSLGSLGNLLGASAVRWDAIWYLRIAEHGYSSRQSTAFFPVYPLLIRITSPLVGSPALAGALISWLSFAAALILLHRLTDLELGRAAANGAVMLLACAPSALFFTAVYTESLFLALALAATYCARHERWAMAGALSAVAAATRITGVLLVALVLFGEGGRYRRRLSERRRLWMLLAPAGLGAYLGGLLAAGFSPLAPLSAQGSAAHAHQFVGPLVALARAISAGAHGVAGLLTGQQPLIATGSLASPFAPGAQSIYLLGVLLAAAAAVVVCSRRLPLGYTVLAVLALLLATASPVAGQPLKSLDRYVLTVFPVWMAAGAWLAERRWLWPVVVSSAAVLVFFTVQFAAWTFVA